MGQFDKYIPPSSPQDIAAVQVLIVYKHKLLNYILNINTIPQKAKNRVKGI